MDTKIFEEVFKTAKAINDFYVTLINPRTYFKEITDEELDEFYRNNIKLFFELSKTYTGFLVDLTMALTKRDSEEIALVISNTMNKVEEIYAEYMDNAVVSAWINAINSAYMRSLLNLQNFMSGVLHSLGMVSRRDVVALSEAYVDLKGDIKKESRKILEEIRSLKERIEKLEKAKRGETGDR